MNKPGTYPLNDMRQSGKRARHREDDCRPARDQKTMHTDTLALSESTTWIRNFDADVETRNVELEQLTERLARESIALELVTNELLPKTRGFQCEIETKQTTLGPFLEEINRLEAGVSVAEGEFVELREQTTKYEVGLADARGKIANLQTSKRENVHTPSLF